MSEQKRVAITGIGMICALGSQREAVWEHMRAGHCGIGPVSNNVTGPMPQCPASMCSHTASRCEPSAQIIPIPVMATRFCSDILWQDYRYWSIPSTKVDGYVNIRRSAFGVVQLRGLSSITWNVVDPRPS